jgi:hypothetical protein
MTEVSADAIVAAVNAAASASEARSLTEHADKARAAHGFESRAVEQDMNVDEALKIGLANQSRSWDANSKRTYDEYQDVSLDTIRRNARYVEKVLSDAQQYDNQRQQLANQSLQNSVETANMVAKQALRPADVTIVDSSKSEDAFMVLLAREVAKIKVAE